MGEEETNRKFLSREQYDLTLHRNNVQREPCGVSFFFFKYLKMDIQLQEPAMFLVCVLPAELHLTLLSINQSFCINCCVDKYLLHNKISSRNVCDVR